LRKLDFPRCAQTALESIATLVTQNQVDSGIPGLSNVCDDYLFVTRDFIFCENTRFTSIQEMQLLEIIVKFYQDNRYPDTTYNSMFTTLFDFGGAMSGRRRDVFYKLVSLTIGVQCAVFLDCAASWMQRQGCHTDVVLRMAESIVNDYCKLVIEDSPILQLPNISQHFTCNFITALTHAYTPAQGTQRITLPPCLLNILTSWLSSDPRLCLASLSLAGSSYLERSSLWTSPTKSNHQTPIPGLVRWSTQAPLLQINPDTGHNEIWSKLHLCMLTTLAAFPSLPAANQLELLTLADMNRIVKETSNLVKNSGGGDCNNSHVTTVLERLTQVIQVAVSTGGFRCSLSDLQSICNNIPSNRLLDILQSQHLTRAPQPMHYQPR